MKLPSDASAPGAEAVHTAQSTADNPAEEAVLEARNLSRSFDDVPVVKGINLAIPHGIIFGFIGPSGSGKTTVVRLLLGTDTPDEGEVELFGKPVGLLSAAERARLGYMPQRFVLYPELSVTENLSFAASLYGVSVRRKALYRDMLDLVELTGHEHKRAAELSGGMRRRLSLAAAIAHEPELIFLDEPTTGIDPLLRQKFWDYFERLRVDGRTLFVTTQYVAEAVHCDLVGLLVEGRLLVVDTPDALRRRALGGDIIHLHLAEFVDMAQLRDLRQQPFVLDGRISYLPEDGLEVAVSDAGSALPKLIEWCKSRNIEIESASEYVPPFDDVFVKLVNQDSSNQERSDD